MNMNESKKKVLKEVPTLKNTKCSWDILVLNLEYTRSGCTYYVVHPGGDQLN